MQIEPKLETKPQLEDKYVLWEISTVLAVCGWRSPTPLYAAIKNLGFPKPIRMGGRRSMWKMTHVLSWIDSRPQELDVKPHLRKKGAKDE